MTHVAISLPDSSEALYYVTIWGHPKERILTTKGAMTYEQWLGLECTRWQDKWREAWVVENSEGLVCMATRSEYILPLD